MPTYMRLQIYNPDFKREASSIKNHDDHNRYKFMTLIKVVIDIERPYGCWARRADELIESLELYEYFRG